MSPNLNKTPNNWLHSISTRIYLAILVTVLPVVLGLGYYVWQQYTDLVNDNIDEAIGIVASTAEYDKNLLDKASEILFNTVYVPAIRNENWRVCSDYLNRIAHGSEEFINMGVISVHGKLVCSGRPNEKNFGVDLNKRLYFRQALKKIDVVISNYLSPTVASVPSVALALRVPSYSGITVGIAYIILNLDRLHIENEWSLLQPDSKIWVLDRNGTVLHSMPEGVNLPGDVLSDSKLDINDIYQSQYTDNSGKAWYSFIKPAGTFTESNIFYVRYDVPKSVIYAHANNYLKFGLGSLVLLLLLAGAMAWVLVQMAAGKSLKQLRQAVIQLANNDLDTRVAHLLQGKELKEIGQQFDVMAATIQKGALSLRQSEYSYRMLFEGIPNPMLVLSLNTGTVMAANDEASRLYGYTKDEFLGLDLSVLRSSVLYDQPHSDFSNERHKHKNGKSLFVEVRNLSLQFRGEPAHVLLIRDVTDRENLSHDLKERDRLISNLFDVTVEAIYGLDANGCCIFANKACARLLGFDNADELIGKHFHTLMHYKHADGTPYLLEDCVIHKNLAKGLGSHVDDEVFWRRDGTSFPAEYWTYPIWNDGRLEFCLVTFLDITERVNQQKALSYQAKHDPLTGLYNRGEIYRYVDEFIKTQPDQPLIMVLDNIDNFKEVNESLGHDIGDLMLQCVADRFSKDLDPGSMLSRIGSDEYVFLLKDSDLLSAYDYVEKVLQNIREPFMLSGLQIRTSMSFGISHYRAHADNAQDLFRFADVARRKAKKDSLGVAIYDVNYSQKSHEKLLLRGEILTALEEKQFLMYLQPKIAINNKNHTKGSIIGFEALVRWQHPKRGILPPNLFIPIIEVSDLVHEFTNRLLNYAIMHCAHMQKTYPGTSLAINVSVKNLMDEKFTEQVKHALDQYEVDAGLIELEVTESSLMADPDRVIDTLNALHNLGVVISIDDFGTGYSSFSYLNRLPIDVLKIDQSFIIGMAEDNSKSVIVKSIIDMAHTLGISVVAEGIESKSVLAGLHEMGCDSGQGFYISKPMEVRETYRWLERQSQQFDF